MMKSEFEDRIGWAVTSQEFEIISTVYTFHPSISDCNGKEEIAELYTRFGMELILDMYPTAVKAQNFENRRLELKAQMKALDEEEADYMLNRGLIL